MALIGITPARAPTGAEPADESAVPSAGALRSQAIHRLQVGLAGLFAMVLLVGLASVIMERAREADRQVARTPAADEAAAARTEAPSDPLADIGAIPSVPVATGSPAAPARP